MVHFCYANIGTNSTSRFARWGDSFTHRRTRRQTVGEIRQLLRAGESVRAKDNDGELTPLNYAARYERIELISVLIGAGADPNECAALHSAAYYGKAPAVDELIARGANKNMTAPSGSTPLHYAAWQGRAEAARALVRAGANLNVQNDGGSTPLHTAVWYHKWDVVQMLIDARANVNMRDTNGRTPLHIAIYNRDKAIISALIRAGADTTLYDNEGHCALQYVIERAQSSDDVRFFLDLGIDTTVRDRNGGTALHWAIDVPKSIDFRDVVCGKPCILQLLVDRGCDVMAIDTAGVRPFALAEQKRNKRAIHILQTALERLGTQGNDGVQQNTNVVVSENQGRARSQRNRDLFLQILRADAQRQSAYTMLPPISAPHQLESLVHNRYLVELVRVLKQRRVVIEEESSDESSDGDVAEEVSNPLHPPARHESH